MRVLVLDDNATERASVVSALQDGSLRVEAVGDAAACLAAIECEAPQVIVLAVTSFGGIETLRLVSGSCDQAYIVAVLDAGKMGPGVSAALAAGAHDFLRRPIVPEQLHARVHAPTRLIKWVQSVSNPAAFCAPYGFEVTRLGAWQNLGELVARDLSQVLGRPMAVTEGWPEHFDDVRAATIPMSLAAWQTEIRVSIAVDRDTAVWLGNALLGEADATEETLDDVVRELANTAGGALKRAALPHNVTFTTGIPVSHRGAKPGGKSARYWHLPLDDGKGCIAVVAEIRDRENLRVPAAKLCEGMVLVYDLRNRTGALLAAAGSRVTNATAARVAQALGERFVVEVACPV